MSPFDMFVMATFIIVTYKAVVDAVNFWKESEELATAHFRAQDAVRKARAQNHVNPKHVRVPCRPSRAPAHVVQRANTNKPRAINTGLNNHKSKVA